MTRAGWRAGRVQRARIDSSPFRLGLARPAGVALVVGWWDVTTTSHHGCSPSATRVSAESGGMWWDVPVRRKRCVIGCALPIQQYQYIFSFIKIPPHPTTSATALVPRGFQAWWHLKKKPPRSHHIAYIPPRHGDKKPRTVAGLWSSGQYGLAGGILDGIR